MAISTAVDASAIARVVGIKVEYVNLAGAVPLLPMQVAVLAQGNDAVTYSNDPTRVFSASEAGNLYGFGSPIYHIVERLLPVNGDGVGTIPVTVYPLDAGAGAAAAVGDVTPVFTAITASGEFRVNVNNILSDPFTVLTTDTVADICDKITAAVQAVLGMPVTATDAATKVTLTAKWSAANSEEINVQIDGPTDIGVTWTVVQPTGGLVDAPITATGVGLELIGSKWETLLISDMRARDETQLDIVQNFGEGRWGVLVHKPLVHFFGTNVPAVSNALSHTDARKTDRVNSQLIAPGSRNLPWVVAARQLARIASLANNNPPHDYGSQPADGLTPGADSVQWDYTEKDAAVKGGSSTTDVVDGVVLLSDIVTCYHPTGDPLPAYRHVVDIIKLMNVIYGVNLIVASEEWDGAPLLPDDTPTANRTAKKPKMMKAEIAGMIDSYALEAILSDPEAAKATIQAGISATNPKRLDVAVTVQVSGNTNIKSVDLNWGFYFGAVAAL